MAKRFIFWSELAKQDFKEITDYYQQNTDEATTFLIFRRVLDAVSLLSEYNVGRASRMNGLLEKSIFKTPYIIAYRLNGELELEIVRLIHSSQNWTSQEFP